MGAHRTQSMGIVLALASAFPLAVSNTGTLTVIAQSPTRSVHVTIADRDGKAPAGLVPGDVEIEEAGRRATVERVAPAAKPLRVAVLISDSGTGRFQQAAAAFISDLLGRGEFSLVSVIAQPTRVNDYTSARPELEKALLGIGPRMQIYGQAQLLEAIRDTLPQLARDGARPVLLVIRAGGEALTALQGNDVRDQLRRTGALVFTISTDNPERDLAAPATGPGSGTGTGGGRGGRGAARGQVASTGEARTGWLELARVLEDGARESGGLHVRTSPEMVAGVARSVATELLGQFEISYVLPAGTKPNGTVKIALKRDGLSIRAPSRRPL